ncbi:hypothetical protein pb186bvf_000225 [Paramecium bursaria]
MTDFKLLLSFKYKIYFNHIVHRFQITTSIINIFQKLIMQNSDSQRIIIASGFASVFSTLLCNPFEVLKIRLQSSNILCDAHVPQKKIRYIHQVALDGPRIVNSQNLFTTIKKLLWLQSLQNNRTNNPFVKIYQKCQCLGTQNLLQAIAQIYRAEGIATFFNGWRYAIMQSGASNISYFLIYEHSKQYIQNNITNSNLIKPLLASGFSRAVTTTITFPLEYWKVLQSSSIGYTKKRNFSLGTQLTSAYFVTIQRDVIFSCVYWPLLENIKLELLKLTKNHNEIVNLMSGVIAGSMTAIITLPLDVVKTRKQVSTRNDLVMTHSDSTLHILQDLYKKEGIQGLFTGLQPRILKVTVHSGLVYMMYEYLKELLKNN